MKRGRRRGKKRELLQGVEVVPNGDPKNEIEK